MKKKLFIKSIIIFFITIIRVYGYDIYSGNINGNKIELFLELNDYGIKNEAKGVGVYSYDKYGVPISFDANLKNNTLVLKNEKEKMTFENFEIDNLKTNGKWENSKKSFKVALNKKIKLEDYNDDEFENLEFLVPVSTKNEFFKYVLMKEKKNSIKVTGLNIYSKKNKFLLQKMKVNAQFIGLRGVELGDYNFDGEKEFSVFESYYGGPNTSSLYFLRDKKTDKFFLSSFAGSSLEFDYENKRIHSNNQSRAGASHIIEEFVVANNEMLLTRYTSIELEFDEKSNNPDKVEEKIYSVGGDKPYTGVIKNFYSNNKIASEINYVHGKMDGFIKEYYPDGQINIEENYKDGKKDGFYKIFYKNGNLQFEYNFKNGRQIGSAKEFYKSGQLKSIKTDFINGVSYTKKKWWENGNLKETSETTNIQDKIRYWREDGTIESEKIREHFTPKKSTDFFYLKENSIQYWKNGNIKSIFLIVNNITEEFKEFYENGNLKGKQIYEENGKPKNFKEYYENNQIKHEKNFKNGFLISEISYDENGILIK